MGDVVTREETKCLYWYDFGDSWRHEIQLERILPNAPSGPLPLCMDGAGACPPENCGGLWGHYAKLKALKDSRHPDHDYDVERMRNFDPGAFDKDAVNRHQA